MAAPQALRTNYGDLYGSSMLPVLEEIFKSELGQHPSRRDQVFKIVSHDRDIWQATEMHDMPLFSSVSEGNDYTFSRPKQGSDKTLTVVKYGLGFSISEEAVDDGKFDLIADATAKLAKSARESQETSAMNIFNNGFTTETSADGQAVFATGHTLPGGSTFRNVPASATYTDLSVTSLETAIADFEKIFVGDSGIIGNVKPKILLVHSDNRQYARRLLGSELLSGTPNNDMNSFKEEGLMLVSSPHLTDTDAWFLLADSKETGLRIVNRKPLETKASGPDVGFMNDAIYYKARYREVIGVTHAYNIYGNRGA